MTTTTESQIFDHMAALADTARCRLLLLLEQQELTVSDLCAVTQLPQSTVSRHLKALLDRGWVQSRPDGTRRLYRNMVDTLEPAAKQLWELAREPVADSPAGKLDHDRLQSVLASQQGRSREFFDAAGGRWDTLRDELFGNKFYLQALVGLAPGNWTVGDLGCGTGSVTDALAPFVANVVGVDASTSMLEAARQRTARFENVDLRHGDLENLPVDDASLDAATFILVLHHLERPDVAIAEAARCLRPGGKLLVVDALPHDRENYRAEMGHVWLGFSPDTMNRYFTEAGFESVRILELPPAPEAKGPLLFAATASLRS